jgi:hypothetical protein
MVSAPHFSDAAKLRYVANCAISSSLPTKTKSKSERAREECKMGLGVSVEVRRCSELSADELRKLYAFGNELMAETPESFFNHTQLQDLAFIFREKGPSRRLVGLSMWRTVPAGDPWVKVIIQGLFSFTPILLFLF